MQYSTLIQMYFLIQIDYFLAESIKLERVQGAQWNIINIKIILT